MRWMGASGEVQHGHADEDGSKGYEHKHIGGAEDHGDGLHSRLPATRKPEPVLEPLDKEPVRIGTLDDGTPVFTWQMDRSGGQADEVLRWEPDYIAPAIKVGDRIAVSVEGKTGRVLAEVVEATRAGNTVMIPASRMANQSVDARSLAAMEDEEVTVTGDTGPIYFDMTEKTAPAIKYVVFKREDWEPFRGAIDSLINLAREAHRRAPMIPMPLSDAEVIRLGDPLAGPGLHAYAGAAQSLLDGLKLGLTWFDEDITEEQAMERADLEEKRDWAHHRAVQADAIRG